MVENSQRVDVHPYEEAQGFQRLLDLPGYDVAALVEKSGKSASHIYARLSLLQLIPAVAEAFTTERITASHANLLARLPQEHQAVAYEQCWRKGWQDAEPYLLPAKHLAAWIEKYLYLTLADAPFNREDPTLNPAAGACIVCPRRSGYNTSLFSDVEGDQCLHAPCYHAKVEAHIDRELAARPELVTIETSWRPPNEQRPGSLPKYGYRELDTPDNPGAEAPCPSTKTALVVFGKRVGHTLTVCIDEACPVHDPATAILANERLQQPEPPVFSPAETELEERHIPEEKAEAEERRRQQEEEWKHAEEERRQALALRQEEFEAEQVRKAELQVTRSASFEHIVNHAPVTFNHTQMRVFLRALITLDEDMFAEVASELADENTADLASDELLLTHLDRLPDEKLTGFALRLVFTRHKAIPFEAKMDSLAGAGVVFAALPPEKAKKSSPKKGKAVAPAKQSKKKAA